MYKQNVKNAQQQNPTCSTLQDFTPKEPFSSPIASEIRGPRLSSSMSGANAAKFTQSTHPTPILYAGKVRSTWKRLVGTA